MVATAFLRSDELPAGTAIGYVGPQDAWRTNHLHLPVRGSGDDGVYSTVRDLVALWTALFAGRIIPRSLVAEAVRPHNSVPFHALRYGLGFWLGTDRDTVILEGYDAGVSSRTVYDPNSGLAYAVLSNTTEGAWPVAKLLDGWLTSGGKAGRSPAGQLRPDSSS